MSYTKLQGSIETASVSTFISWPSLINYRYSVCPCGSSLLLVTMQTTNSTHRN